jgi:hypothetical protein
MAQALALAPSAITNQMELRAGHFYWDDRKLEADRFIYSFVNKKEPTCFGGNQEGLAAGATTFAASALYDTSDPTNAAYHAHLGQTPNDALSVTFPTAADIISTTGMVAGEFLEFSYTNLSTDAEHIITVAAASGGLQEIGLMTINKETTARFRIYISSTTAGLLIRL